MHTAQQGLGPHKNHSETLGTAPSHSKGHADGCRCFVGKTKQGKPSSTQARTHTMSTPIPSFIHGNPGLMHFLKKKGTGDRKRTKKGKGAKTCKNGKERNRTPCQLLSCHLCRLLSSNRLNSAICTQHPRQTRLGGQVAVPKPENPQHLQSQFYAISAVTPKLNQGFTVMFKTAAQTLN